jgi:hypothetical protein
MRSPDAPFEPARRDGPAGPHRSRQPSVSTAPARRRAQPLTPAGTRPVPVTATPMSDPGRRRYLLSVDAWDRGQRQRRDGRPPRRDGRHGPGLLEHASSTRIRLRAPRRRHRRLPPLRPRLRPPVTPTTPSRSCCGCSTASIPIAMACSPSPSCRRTPHRASRRSTATPTAGSRVPRSPRAPHGRRRARLTRPDRPVPWRSCRARSQSTITRGWAWPRARRTGRRRSAGRVWRGSTGRGMRRLATGRRRGSRWPC